MDLIVLDKQDFVLEELPARDLLQNIAETLAPVLRCKDKINTFGSGCVCARGV